MVTVAESRDPVTTMGGVRLVPDALLDDLDPGDALGTTLYSTIQSLVTWTEAHQNEIAAARADYDARAAAPA